MKQGCSSMQEVWRLVLFYPGTRKPHDMLSNCFIHCKDES